MSTPFLPPHSIRRDFLPASTVARLLDFALAHEADFAAARVGYGEHLSVNPGRRISRTLKDIGLFKAELGRHFRALAPALIAELKLSPFDTHAVELELAAHGDGAFFARHTDIQRPGDAPQPTRRVLSGVYYFHAQPPAFSGGALRLHEILPQGGAPRSIDIAPGHNTAVFFPAWMPHEVMPVRVPSGRFADSRFAVNCWFHRATA